jgi:DNA invertase Pin-like site-specific DNA recombinase
MKRAAIYVRVSTDQQTVENQLKVLHEVAERSGWTIVHVFADEGISGAKGRDKRPGFDALLNAITRREIDIIAAWSVDRLGRSLSDLVSFLSDIQARGCDLYLHQQAIDTSTPSGRMLFQMLAVFAEFERSIITARIRAGQDRARSNGVRFGRPSLPPDQIERVRKALKNGQGSIRTIAKKTRVSTATVMRIKRSIGGQEPRQQAAST